VHPLVLNLVLVRVERHRLLVLVHRPPQRAAAVTFQQVAVLAAVQRAGLLGRFLFEQPPGRPEVVLVAERLVPLDWLVLVHADFASMLAMVMCLTVETQPHGARAGGRRHGIPARRSGGISAIR
jgi:hypothetical protein